MANCACRTACLGQQGSGLWHRMAAAAVGKHASNQKAIRRPSAQAIWRQTRDFRLLPAAARAAAMAATVAAVAVAAAAQRCTLPAAASSQPCPCCSSFLVDRHDGPGAPPLTWGVLAFRDEGTALECGSLVAAGPLIPGSQLQRPPERVTVGCPCRLQAQTARHAARDAAGWSAFRGVAHAAGGSGKLSGHMGDGSLLAVRCLPAVSVGTSWRLCDMLLSCNRPALTTGRLAAAAGPQAHPRPAAAAG